MNDAPNVAQQPPSVTPGDFFEMPCANPQCAKAMHLEIPRIEVVNQRSYSAYHFPHEELQQCEHCGQSYVFVLMPLSRGGMSFSFRPVQAEQQKRIIVAGGNSWTDKQLKEN